MVFKLVVVRKPEITSSETEPTSICCSCAFTNSHQFGNWVSRLIPVRNQCGTSPGWLEIEKSGCTIPKSYSSEPVRKKPPVRKIKFQTSTSSETRGFQTNRRLARVGYAIVLYACTCFTFARLFCLCRSTRSALQASSNLRLHMLLHTLLYAQ